MIAKALEDITLQDLDDLRNNEVSEGLILDYKLTWSWSISLDKSSRV